MEEELEVVSSETVAEITVWIYKVFLIIEDTVKEITLLNKSTIILRFLNLSLTLFVLTWFISDSFLLLLIVNMTLGMPLIKNGEFYEKTMKFLLKVSEKIERFLNKLPVI